MVDAQVGILVGCALSGAYVVVSLSRYLFGWLLGLIS